LASNRKSRSENETQVQRDVNANALTVARPDFLLMDGDIKVDIVKAGLSNKVEIRGEVTFPGIYELRKTTGFDIINRAGSVTRNTFCPEPMYFVTPEILQICNQTGWKWTCRNTVTMIPGAVM
jgi:hypothetical protein